MRTIDDLAGYLKGVPDPGILLFIGWDGGAALLGHSAPKAFLLDLLRDEADAELRRRKVSKKWSSLDEAQRELLLERNFRSTNVDRPALTVITRLVAAGHVRGIVASDPSGELHRCLTELGANLQWENCSTTIPEILRKLPVGRGRAMFFNMSELLLEGIDDSVHGLSLEQMDQTRKCFQTLTMNFKTAIVWGWSQHNIDHGQVFHNAQKILCLLGDSSDVGSLERSGNRLVDWEGPCTTAILLKLGTTLWGAVSPSSEHSPADVRKAAPAEGAAQRTEVPTSSLPFRLLWPPNALRELGEDAEQASFLIVGADGDRVRRSMAGSICSQLTSRGFRCRHFSLTALEELESRFSAAARGGNLQYLVASLNSERRTETATSAISDSTRRFLEGATWRPKLVLLIPIKSAEALSLRSAAARIFSSVACVVAEYFERWMSASTLVDFGLLLQGEGATVAPNVSAISQRIAALTHEKFGYFNGRRLDCIQDALEFWEEEVASAIVGPNFPRGDLAATADELVQIWGEVLDNFVPDAAQESFELEVKKRGPGGGGDDFDLGNIQKRKS